MLKWKWFRRKETAICWLIIITVLFFIPGSALPKKNWLSDIHFDKWVHVGLFAVLLFLWRSAFENSSRSYHLILLILAFVYGFAVEWLQGELVRNRSFDLFDLVADMAGSVLGLFVWLRVYKK